MARSALGLAVALIAAACTGAAVLAAAAGCRERLDGGDEAIGVLAAYDLPSGTRRWETGMSLPEVAFTVPFAVAGDLVMVKEGDVVWGLDAETCGVRWELPGRQVLALASGEGVVAVVDSFALRMVGVATGKQRWSYGIRWEPPARVTFTPRFVVMTLPDRELVVLDAATGDDVARAGFDGFPSAPHIVGDRVYVTHESTVEARALTDASLCWSGDLGFAINPGLDFSDGAVYVVSAEDATVAAHRGRAAEVRGAPLVDHEEVHLVDTDRRFHHLAAIDGSTVFVGRGDAARARLAPATGLLLEDAGGLVTAFTLRERRAWALATGAGAGRVSLLHFGDGFATVLSFDWS